MCQFRHLVKVASRSFHQCVYSYLVLLSSSLLIVFQDVVSDIIFWVNEELLCLSLFIPPLHPHHKQEHQYYSVSEKNKDTSPSPGLKSGRLQ